MPHPDHRARMPGRPQAQRGLSMVELLVGLTIGLLVIGAAMGTLRVSRAAAGTVGDLGLLQSQGAYALRVIGLQVRQAGSIEPSRDPASGRYSFDDRFPGFAGGGTIVTGSDGAGAGTDTLSVSHQDSDLADSHRLDCLAETVRSGDEVDSSFFVSNGELRCRTAAKNQPLIGNVADFQVWYRVRTADAATQRMTATQVRAADLWSQVHAIDVCLDLRGNERAGPQASYPDCHGIEAPAGGRLHLVFRSAFELRTRGAG